MRLKAPERGFGLVAAMFLIIIIAAVIATMARLSVTQNATTSLAIQQARAYQAARAGLEYGIARVLAGQGCAALDLDGFAVTVSCPSPTTVEIPEENKTIAASTAARFYQLTATAEYGGASSPDYAFRRLSAVVER